MSEKTIRPPSWLGVIQAAEAGFTGEARLVEDVRVTGPESSYRGGSYRLTAEVAPRRTLFGTSPDAPARLRGETRLAPDARIALGTDRFPPDDLRRTPYWDYARPGVIQPVLALLAEPSLVRPLTGPNDDLPDAVAQIHRWTGLPEARRQAAVLADLRVRDLGPVAYVAGFDLLIGTTLELPALFRAFVDLPGCPGTAIQGIVDVLYRVGTSLSSAEIAALARSMLDTWQRENDPAALSSYLLWFDAHRQRTWSTDPEMREAVLAEAERARTSRFAGPHAKAWEEQVRYYASTLLSVPGDTQ